MPRPLRLTKSSKESRKERRLKEEVEELVGKLKEKASNLKLCEALLSKIEEVLGEDLTGLIGPPPLNGLSKASATIISPEDKETKLSPADIEKELKEGFHNFSADRLKVAVEKMLDFLELSENECLKYLEAATDILLANTETLLKPFEGSKAFNELLLKVEEARSYLLTSKDLTSINKALDLVLYVRSLLKRLKPKALMQLKSTASTLLAESEAAHKEAVKAKVNPLSLEDKVAIAERMKNIEPDTTWEQISYYRRELEEGLHQLRAFKDSVGWLEELRRVKTLMNHVASSFPELKGGVEEAEVKVKGLIEAAEQGRMLELEDVKEAQAEVEEAFRKAGADRLLKELSNLHREVSKELRRKSVEYSVETPPSNLKGGALLNLLAEAAKCKDDLEGLLRTMTGSAESKPPMTVSSLKEKLLKTVKSS
ncbi:MAG: hypothetical protein DRJ98_07635 [Thermoprotei archaeon]|nr:MAG: hypothetical protein DRJ98_07635 [Thermoprotei archaeon]RLF17591.1 MAG: hypothetical protein DRN06_03570 [Thermoprotei archaeon]